MLPSSATLLATRSDCPILLVGIAPKITRFGDKKPGSAPVIRNRSARPPTSQLGGSIPKPLRRPSNNWKDCRERSVRLLDTSAIWPNHLKKSGREIYQFTTGHWGAIPRSCSWLGLRNSPSTAAPPGSGLHGLAEQPNRPRCRIVLSSRRATIAFVSSSQVLWRHDFDLRSSKGERKDPTCHRVTILRKYQSRFVRHDVLSEDSVSR
jgi:hypothetical protein